MSCLALLPADGSTFGAQFWPALIATVIGAFLGFGLALRADHAREQSGREAREAALLRAARDAIQHNLQLLAQLTPILAAVPPMPSFEMDVVILDAVLPQLAERSPDTDLLAQLNDFRFQLHHINRKLDHLLHVALAPVQPGVPVLVADERLVAALKEIAASVMLTVQNLERSGQQTLLSSINVRIAQLDPPWRLPWWGFWGG